MGPRSQRGLGRHARAPLSHCRRIHRVRLSDRSQARDHQDPPRRPGPPTGTGTCHGTLLVATGQLDAFLLLGAGPWDIAALVPVIEEAGGTYAALAETPSADTASALFTNPDLSQQIIDIANDRS